MSLPFNLEEVFRTEHCRRFVRAWMNWRGDALVPSRADLNLEDIKDILPNIAIYDVISAEEAIFRLVGTAAREMANMELTGMNWITLAPPEHQEERGRRAINITQHPCATWSRSWGEHAPNYRYALEYSGFPIRPSNDASPPQIIGCFHQLEDVDPTEDTLGQITSVRNEEFQYLDIGAGLP